MVSVAKSFDAPIKLLFPTADAARPFSMFGLGDIVILGTTLAPSPAVSDSPANQGQASSPPQPAFALAPVIVPTGPATPSASPSPEKAAVSPAPPVESQNAPSPVTPPKEYNAPPPVEVAPPDPTDEVPPPVAAPPVVVENPTPILPGTPALLPSVQAPAPGTI